MTTTTPTPAQECNDKLADLDFDLDELQALCDAVKRPWYGTCQIADGVTDDDAVAFIEAFSPDTVSELIALARRAAQPVAPVQDKPAATVIKKGADRQWMSENLGSLPDGVYSLYLAPSPQIAEVAEQFDTDIRSLRAGADWIRTRSPHMAVVVDEAIQSIAASRRAAGGEATDDLAWNKEALARVRGKLESVWDGIRAAVEKYSGQPCEGEPFDRLDELLARLATPAPASAGQAAPAVSDAARALLACLDGLPIDTDEATADQLTAFDRTRSRMQKALAAQPAEGAGQAGQVVGYQMLARPEVFYPVSNKPTDINNFREVYAAPTERAAVPVDISPEMLDKVRMDWLESHQATLRRLYSDDGYILAVDGKAVRTGKSARAVIDFAIQRVAAIPQEGGEE